MSSSCPVCEGGHSDNFADIDDYAYLRCQDCGSIHITSSVLLEIDQGRGVRTYDQKYWKDELIAARERAEGVSLVRAGEAILYSRRPVSRFLDVGTGPGYLLDELCKLLPQAAATFYGVELFPPDQRSSNPHYLQGDVRDLKEAFDAGVCIEVVEHLTPHMLASLAHGLASVSKPDTLWLFSTGMPDYVIEQDPAYLDPIRRGHIVSYSLAGLRHIFAPHGFRVTAIPGKNYAFVAEYQPQDAGVDFEQRIHQPLPENIALLQHSGLLLQAALESASSSRYQDLFLSRTRWAQSLDQQLIELGKQHVTLQEEHARISRWAQKLDLELTNVKKQRTWLQEHYAGWALSALGSPVRRIVHALRHWLSEKRR